MTADSWHRPLSYGPFGSEWAEMRLKRTISEARNGIWGDDPGGENDLLCVRVADFDRSRLRTRDDKKTYRSIPLKDRPGRLLNSGDLLLEKSGGGENTSVGRVVEFTLKEAAVCSNFVARLVPTCRCSPRFLVYLHSALYDAGATLPAIKQTTGIQNLDEQQYLDILVRLPDKQVQELIAANLDRWTAKIDGLIDEKQRLLKLLDERRQALVTEAVTRGLNPAVSLKSSGLTWLGDIPAHWGVSRLANLFEEVVEDGVEDLPILSVSIHAGVSDYQMGDDEMDRTVVRSEDRTKYKRVRPGDLVYNMMRAWQGGFGTVTVNGMVSPAYVVARAKVPLRTRFVELVLRTPMATQEMRRSSHGIADFRLRLYWNEFRNIRLPTPSLTEQDLILAMVETQCAEIDSRAGIMAESIKLLAARRSSLIHEAVTGRLAIGRTA